MGKKSPPREWKRRMLAGEKAVGAGRLDVARQHFLQALAIAREFTPDNDAVEESLHRLSGVHQLTRDWAAVEEVVREEIAVMERKGSPDPGKLAACLMMLGQSHLLQDAFDAAAGALKRALAVCEAAAPEGEDVHPVALILLSDAMRGLGNLWDAERHAEKAIEVAERVELPLEVMLAYRMRLAQIWADMGGRAEAANKYRAIAADAERFETRPGSIWWTATSNLAWSTENLYESEALVRKLVEVAERETPIERKFIAEMRAWLGERVSRLGKDSEARRESEAALAVLQTTHGPSKYLPVALGTMGRVRRAEGARWAAALLFKRAIEAEERLPHPRVQIRVEMMVALADSVGPGTAKGMDLLNQAVGAATEARMEESRILALDHLASALLASGQFQEAVAAYHQSFALRKARFLARLSWWRDTIERMERFLAKKGVVPTRAYHYREAVNQMEKDPVEKEEGMRDPHDALRDLLETLSPVAVEFERKVWADPRARSHPDAS